MALAIENQLESKAVFIPFDNQETVGVEGPVDRLDKGVESIMLEAG
jgi:hypothetical protein